MNKPWIYMVLNFTIFVALALRKLRWLEQVENRSEEKQKIVQSVPRKDVVMITSLAVMITPCLMRRMSCVPYKAAYRGKVCAKAMEEELKDLVEASEESKYSQNKEFAMFYAEEGPSEAADSPGPTKKRPRTSLFSEPNYTASEALSLSASPNQFDSVIEAPATATKPGVATPAKKETCKGSSTSVTEAPAIVTKSVIGTPTQKEPCKESPTSVTEAPTTATNPVLGTPAKKEASKGSLTSASPNQP